MTQRTYTPEEVAPLVKERDDLRAAAKAAAEGILHAVEDRDLTGCAMLAQVLIDRVATLAMEHTGT